MGVYEMIYIIYFDDTELKEITINMPIREWKQEIFFNDGKMYLLGGYIPLKNIRKIAIDKK